MRPLHLLVSVFFLACAAPVVMAPPPPPKPVETPIDLNKVAIPVKLDTQFEMKGYTIVFVEGTDLRIELLETKWEEMTIGGATTREGRAKLQATTAKETKVVSIDEGEEQTVFGYRLAVEYAYEFYDQDASYKPHVKMKVMR